MPETTTGARTPTPEQQAIREDARRNPGRGRKVVAAAGSGKTTTLEMLAQDRRDPGMYLAFNRSIKLEAARRFPPHVKVATPHSAAYGALRVHEQQARLDRRIFGDAVGQLVRLPRCRMPEDALGQVVLDTVARFCNSADEQIGVGHVPLDPREPEDVRLAAMSGAQALWRRMSDRNDDCPITHDVYLKLWHLGGARLRGFEWALFDEAQDASPVMIDVMRRQDFPVTWVGDEHQQVYAFRGAVNAMRIMPGPQFTLSQSFRFGQQVAALANAVLACKPEGLRPTFQIAGNPSRASQVGRVPKTERHAFLARTNAEWFQEALRYEGRVHVIGGIDETEKLLAGAWSLWRYSQRPERCPAIARFATWAQLCEHAERFDDRELTFARRIVEQYQQRLPAAIADLKARHTPHEMDAGLVLSTAHKAKGREFALVRLGAGFPSPLDEEWERMSPEAREAELNLLYVALTRAVDGLEPNPAVLDCLALARGQAAPGQPAPPPRLPTIRVAQPQAAQHPAPPPAAAPAPGAPEPEPPADPAKPKKARKKRAAPEGAAPAPGAAPRLWSADEDAEALKMAGQGFDPEDIAAWLSRPAAAVCVRLSVLRAPGADQGLAAEILAAMFPPAAPAARPPEDPPPPEVGPVDFLHEFPALDDLDAQAEALATVDQWAMAPRRGPWPDPRPDPRADEAAAARARLAPRRPFGR